MDALAVGQVDGLLLAELEPLEQLRRGSGRRDECGGDVEALERLRILDPEVADARAAKSGEVTADAERGAQVAGERTDVRARRAHDAHVEIDRRSGSPGLEDLELRHRHRPGVQDDVLPRAHPGVRASAIDLDRAHRARNLLDLPGESRYPRIDR